MVYLRETALTHQGLGSIGLNPASDDLRYAPGTLVRLTVTCDYQFEVWTGDLPEDVNTSFRSIIITMDHPRAITADCAAGPPVESRYSPKINGETLKQGQLTLLIPNGSLQLNQSPDEDGEFLAELRLGLLASPNQSHFQVNWSGVDSENGNFATVIMDRHREVEISIIRPFFILSASPNPDNGGTVVGGGRYLSGTQATPQATPNTGWTFSNWTGACGGTGVCTIAMNSNQSVFANFKLISNVFSLTTGASPSAGGTVSPSGSTTYTEGTSVTVTATAADTYTLREWSGACSGSGTCTVTMDANRSVTANFDGETSVAQYTLTTAASTSLGGSVSPSGTNTYNEGTSVTVTATAAEGYTFSNWSGDCTSSGSCSLTMDGNKTGSANFVAALPPTAGRILFDRSGDIRISWMYSDGSGMTHMPTFAQGSGYTWSQDGAKIAFASSSTPYGINVVDADGSNGSLVFGASARTSDPSWSPDSTKLVFETDAHVEVINVDGSNPINLTGGPGSGYEPNWSPQGGKIAFGLAPGGVWSVHVMNENGSNIVNLASNSIGPGASSWSPGGIR